MQAIAGMVFSDRGEGARFVALEWVRCALRERLGFEAYPGTLNLRLDTEQARETWRCFLAREPGLALPARPGFCRARLFPARVVAASGAVGGAVLLPEVEGYPEAKIEVVAPLRLKQHLGLQDGDRVTLELLGAAGAG